ncbi:MAG: polyphosphate kinase 1 [Elusimicrobia bacterium]|nr:polyphosphate kinase 1 [Elusimicrobiota bacterium]
MPSQPPPKWISLAEHLRAGAPAARAPEAGALLGGRLYNRDLSWLSFNERVLEEAADPSVPALERLRFAAIVSSNLDEFFMIRVAEIANLARRFPARRFADGMRARQVLAQIRERVLRQKGRQAEVLKEILSALAREGIVILTDFTADRSLDRELRAHLPQIQLIVRRSSEPLPRLHGGGIQVFVRFPREYAVLHIIDREARLIRLPSSGHAQRFALAERWLSDRAQEFFPGREVVEAFPFKVLRDADLRYRPDDEETLEEQIVSAVERRGRAKIVRLEVDSPEYSEGAMFLATALGVDSAGIYRFDLPLDLRTLATVYGAKTGARLHYAPIRPQTPEPLRRPQEIFAVLRRHDVLLHHPYDSFDIVVKFLERAARDPRVTHIFHMVYRTSRASPIMEALKEAARRGKQVTAYIEIKARFDEINNVRWAAELRKAGVRVVRPLGGYKVHSKLTQVLRQEGGAAVSYLHLGTGNYHPGTARQYTDLGLLTCDETLGREVTAYCEALAGRRSLPAFDDLLVAPKNLHSEILRLTREETRIQRAGGSGHVIAKMNSLVDPDIIDALYEASAAGVKVDLLVRGICCLRPGMPGLSENIRVLSVVDRFLEHSRIFYFRSGGKRKVYLSSADWMPRNFYSRFETAFPIKDPALKKYIREVILANGLADNVKGWALRPDGAYARVQRPSSADEIRSQFVFEVLAGKHYRDTILEHRIKPADMIQRPS